MGVLDLVKKGLIRFGGESGGKIWKKRKSDEYGNGIIDETGKCPSCHNPLDSGILEENLSVCHVCTYHFQLTALERISMIADHGSFRELFEDVESVDPLEFPGYYDKILKSKQKTGLKDAVVTGECYINERPALLGVMSFDFMGGSMGSVVGEKLTRLLFRAGESDRPVIICSASGGARMQEGIFSLMQMAKTSHAAALLAKRKIPFFVVLTHPTTGGVTASFAMLGNVILAEPGALIGFAGPRVIESTIRQKLPEGFQRAEFQLSKGFVDAVVDRRQLKSTLTMLMDAHSGSAGGM